VLRTSTFADFANQVMPQEAIDVTGIFTRYRNTWQILLRTLDDVQPAQTFSVNDLPGTGQGTAEEPFNVERALALVESGNNDPTAEVYVKGIISQVNEVDTGQYGNATYFISDDGTDAKQLEIYRGYYLNGDKFTEDTKDMLSLGKKVTIAGKLVLYGGSTIEFTSGSKIMSIE
jgi:DNA/RNA endonuclease YhcR with UshA esterase domain